jgi:hypothetical protein
VIRDETLPTHALSLHSEVVYPVGRTVFHDAVEFAAITPQPKNTRILCVEGTNMADSVITCLTNIPHGLADGTKVRVVEHRAEGGDDDQNACTAYNDKACGYFKGSLRDLNSEELKSDNVTMRGVVFEVENFKDAVGGGEFKFRLRLPFVYSGDALKAFRYIELEVVETPLMAHAGMVVSGVASSGAERMIVVRRDNPPVLIAARTGFAPQQLGVSKVGRAVSGAYALAPAAGTPTIKGDLVWSGARNGVEPVVAIANEDGATEIYQPGANCSLKACKTVHFHSNLDCTLFVSR